MIGFLIEYRVPGKRQWHPVGIAGMAGESVDELINRVKIEMPQIVPFEIRLRKFERIPSNYMEGSILGSIPVITDVFQPCTE